jgi:hypothetical protein
MATRTWDAAYEAIPAGSEQISLGDDRIRNLKVDVRERFSQGGHVIQDTTNSNDGKHAVNADGSGKFRVFRADKTTEIITTTDSVVTIQGTGGTPQTFQVVPDGTTARLTQTSSALTAATPTTINSNTTSGLTVKTSNTKNLIVANETQISLYLDNVEKLRLSGNDIAAQGGSTVFKDNAGVQLLSRSNKRFVVLEWVGQADGGGGPNVENEIGYIPQSWTGFAIQEAFVWYGSSPASGVSSNRTIVVSKKTPVWTSDQSSTNHTTALTTVLSIAVNSGNNGGRTTTVASNPVAGDILRINGMTDAGTWRVQILAFVDWP